MGNGSTVGSSPLIVFNDKIVVPPTSVTHMGLCSREDAVWTFASPDNGILITHAVLSGLWKHTVLHNYVYCM